MQTISYKQRICRDEAAIEAFLNETRVGIVSMIDSENIPYATPVNFVWHQNAIYFHGMGTGKKEKILSKKAYVCFTLFHEFGTVVDPMPCHADTAYRSAMIFGDAVRVDSNEEVAEALQKILDKFTPNFYKSALSSSLVEKYRSSHDNKAVAVFKIVPHEMTVKENNVPCNQLFNNEA